MVGGILSIFSSFFFLNLSYFKLLIKFKHQINLSSLIFKASFTLNIFCNKNLIIELLSKRMKKVEKRKKRIPYQFSFHCFTDLSFKLTTGYFSQFPEFCGQTQSPRGLFYVTRPSQRLASYWPGDILLSSSSCAFSLSCFVLLLSCHNPPSNSPSSYARDAYASVLFWGC